MNSIAMRRTKTLYFERNKKRILTMFGFAPLSRRIFTIFEFEALHAQMSGETLYFLLIKMMHKRENIINISL